jgi:hypothetical protein
MRSDRERELVSPITCGGTAEALQERCAAILEQIAPDRFDGKNALEFSDAESHVGLVYLRPVPVDKRVESICVEMFPAMTAFQAQKCNCEVLDARFEGASELIDKGWTVRPWLTFRYRAFIRCQPGVRLDADRSLSFWHARSGMIRAERDRQLDSGVWRDVWAAAGLVRTEDRNQILTRFSQKQKVNICPGWRLRYQWPLAEAERLDILRISPGSQQTLFVGAVLGKMREAFDAMGQDFDGLVK